jgi:hypothetical protein
MDLSQPSLIRTEDSKLLLMDVLLSQRQVIVRMRDIKIESEIKKEYLMTVVS